MKKVKVPEGMSSVSFAMLSKKHEGYRDYNQQQRSDDVLMVKKKHPFAEAYTEIRAVFDSQA